MTISQANVNQLRPSDDDGGFGSIIHVGPDRQPEAISKLLASGVHTDRDHARRFIDFARDHRINLDGMWSRLDRQGRIETTVLTVPSPGRTAMVFASRALGTAQIGSLAGLIAHAVSRLADANVNLAQVLIDPGDELDREVFLAAGFIDLAVLSYLERPLRLARSQLTPRPSWPQGVTPVTYESGMRGELIDVLSQSYEDTLDCPGLRGYRQTEDILEGHRASGIFDPKLWTILREHDQPIGALLLNPSADHAAIELVYLGLAKSARGRGLGLQLLRHGLNLVQHRGERTINLAVDEANSPAMSLYLREGFRPALRRMALIRGVA